MLLRAFLRHARVVFLVRALGNLQRYAILRSARARKTRLDRAEVELDHIGVLRGLRAVVTPQPLGSGVVLDQMNLLRRAAREPQVAQRLLVDRKDRAGAAELR